MNIAIKTWEMELLYCSPEIVFWPKSDIWLIAQEIVPSFEEKDVSFGVGYF